jgi:NADH:ubiquinone oxidoreductase subunit 4 (subunit M)
MLPVIDLKIVIAYSSVVHMALIIFNFLRVERIHLRGVWWVMFRTLQTGFAMSS